MAGELERQREAGWVAARMYHEVRPLDGGRWRCERYPERGGDRRPGGIDVHQLHVASRNPGGEPCCEAADGASAHHRDTITHVRPAVPQSVDCRLQVRRKHGARRRNVVWERVYRVGGHDETRLMRMEHEDRTTHEGCRAALDATHTRVSVFHRGGEVADLKRRPHAAPFALWHAAIEDKRLGAAADAAVKRLHQYFPFGRRPHRLVPNLSATGRRHPERSGVLLHPWTF